MCSEVYCREARGARGLPTMEKGLSLCLISMTIDKGDCLPSMCLCQYGSDFHNTLF